MNKLTDIFLAIFHLRKSLFIVSIAIGIYLGDQDSFRYFSFNPNTANLLIASHGPFADSVIQGLLRAAHCLVRRYFRKITSKQTEDLTIGFQFSFYGFLDPLAVGQRAYVMARCPSCVRLSVRPSVR